jgi:hypothetical protein
MKNKEQILQNLVGYVDNRGFHIQGSENAISEHFWLKDNGFEGVQGFRNWYVSEKIQESDIGCGECGKCLGIVRCLQANQSDQFDEETCRYICCICKKECVGFGNNPSPYIPMKAGRCCRECDGRFVVPARIKKLEIQRQDEHPNWRKGFVWSKVVTKENLTLIDFEKVLFVHITDPSGMGNTGGIILYVLEGDKLQTYESNIIYQPEIAKPLGDRFYKNDNFVFYNGGMGNMLYVRNDIHLEVDRKRKHIWFSYNNTKQILDLYSLGLFESLAGVLERKKV